VVQFVLAEDVFPRLNLRPGLPYALSSLVKYAIVSVGFVLALLALGVNLNRVTVLGGALGIGVGFGLQNIVNNFVSGLILLFERPVRVGDAVQIGDVQGEVRRIGIRATTVHAWEGAEVIVPNSQLVAERVTNWTPVDYRRRLDIPVGVAYSSAPDKVLQVLTEVAQSHPESSRRRLRWRCSWASATARSSFSCGRGRIDSTDTSWSRVSWASPSTPRSETRGSRFLFRSRKSAFIRRRCRHRNPVCGRGSARLTARRRAVPEDPRGSGERNLRDRRRP
jgi:small-conductance mechanosensitive channel